MDLSAEHLISLPQFARRRAVSQQRIRQLIAAGRIPGARKIGRNWLISEPGTIAPGDGRARTESPALRWVKAVVVPSLRSAHAVEKVIVFGSHARGSASRESDLDVCVIVRSRLDFFRRCVAVQKAIPRGAVYVDALAYTPEEMARNCDLPLFREILREGLVVYER
ncbi:MAG: nucleotidyltransferase domain-containing protein [Betaproteobacteria bacterium]|nr:nucleotidyltransferase domain-containing protein [Betaproteobacteria bacterium]